VVAVTQATKRPGASSRRLVVGWVALLAGPVAAVWTVWLGVPLQSRPEKRLLGTWYLLSTPLRPGTLDGYWLVAAISLLCLLWLRVAWTVHCHPGFGRWATRAAWLWVAPFALAAPFQSRDVYSYIAQGAVLDRGLDPYRSAPQVLGAHNLMLQAVDPSWRFAAAPYGPVALRLSQAAIALGGHGAGALVVLRVLALISVLGIVLLLRQGTPAHKDLVTWLALSPLTLVQLIAAMHWEAEQGLVLVLAIVLAQRGHLEVSLLVALVACDIKASALVVVAVLALEALRRRGRHAAADMLLAVAIAGVATVLSYQRDAWGWVGNLGVAAKGWSPYTPAATLFLVLGHLQPGHAQLLSMCRALIVVAAAVLVLVILRRPGRDVATTSCALLLAGIAALPTVWPWYIAPATLLMLLGTPRRWWWGAALAAAGSLAALPITTEPAQRVNVAAEAVAVVASLSVFLRSRRTSLRALSGRLSAASATPGHPES
jgi:hypothetical protein